MREESRQEPEKVLASEYVDSKFEKIRLNREKKQKKS